MSLDLDKGLIAKAIATNFLADFVFIVGFSLLLLFGWNWSITIYGNLPQISYLQAVGISMLIIFLKYVKNRLTT